MSPTQTMFIFIFVVRRAVNHLLPVFCVFLSHALLQTTNETCLTETWTVYLNKATATWSWRLSNCDTNYEQSTSTRRDWDTTYEQSVSTRPRALSDCPDSSEFEVPHVTSKFLQHACWHKCTCLESDCLVLISVSSVMCMQILHGSALHSLTLAPQCHAFS